VNFDANAVLGFGYGCLIIAFIMTTFCLWKADEYLCAVASGVLGGWLMLWAVALIWRLVDRAVLLNQGASLRPAATTFSLLLLFPLTCGAVALVMEREYHTKALSPFTVLIALGAGGYALFVPSSGVSLPQSADGWSVVYHLGMVFSYSMFLVAGTASVFELLRPVLNRKIQEYQSSPDTMMEGLTIQTIRWGLVLLSATLIVGAVRSWLMSGSYWNWALVEVWMLVIWAVYSAYLHLGRFRGWAIAASLGMALVASAIGTL